MENYPSLKKGQKDPNNYQQESNNNRAKMPCNCVNRNPVEGTHTNYYNTNH